MRQKIIILIILLGALIIPSDISFADFDKNPVQKSNFQEPDVVKAVYLTSRSASQKSKIDYLINLAKTTELNAVVIDIKDFSGYVAYDTDNALAPKVKEYKAKQKRISNIDALIDKLHQEGIYVIGRITVFQDPVLARVRPDLAIYRQYDKLSFSSFTSLLAAISIWLDNLKLAWVDPSSEEVWDYNVSIAKEALSRGFDEINFDYIRFPSDGDLKNMRFPLWDGEVPRRVVIKKFFEYLREKLPQATLSIDIFGLATISYNDLGVGQVIEDAFEYFDYVSPMVYPSHYAKGFLGYENPAQYPYEVINYSMMNALARLKIFQLKKSESKRKVHLRPWLQDFNLGARYDKEMVKAEIKAVQDVLKGEDFKGFMLWNPWNYYTKEALE